MKIFEIDKLLPLMIIWYKILMPYWALSFILNNHKGIGLYLDSITETFN